MAFAMAAKLNTISLPAFAIDETDVFKFAQGFKVKVGCSGLPWGVD